jgi:hypothetical protein
VPEEKSMTTTNRQAAEAGSYRVGDLDVNRIGYGAMQLAGPGVFGPPRDRAAAIEVLRTAVELGEGLGMGHSLALEVTAEHAVVGPEVLDHRVI